jgi:cytidine deaminase
MTDRELLDLSVEAQKYAYAPYSNFKVGAALLCADGKVFIGCNVENVSYGATCCAERTAVFKAVSEGCADFAAIAITSSSNEPTFPCGVCRQVLAEFSPAMRVVLRTSGGEAVSYPLQELLPHVFDHTQ